MSEAVQEALHFIHARGWSTRKAIAVTGACPKLVKTAKMRVGKMACFVPTPDEISQQCDEFRRVNPRHLSSYGASGSSTKEKAIREYSVNASSVGFTFDAS